MKKKILFLAAIIIQVFSACRSDFMDDIHDYPKTQYTFKIEDDYWDSPSLIKVDAATLLEYNKQGDPIMQHRVDDCHPGMKYHAFVASDNACKVKVCLHTTHYDATYGEWMERTWAKMVYYLKKEEQIEIVINADTLMSQSEP